MVVMEPIWGRLWRGVLGMQCVHLLERVLARSDVREDVGETLSGHYERCVWVWSVVDCENVDWEGGGITVLVRVRGQCWQRRCCSANRHEPRPNSSSAAAEHSARVRGCHRRTVPWRHLQRLYTILYDIGNYKHYLNHPAPDKCSPYCHILGVRVNRIHHHKRITDQQ